MIELIREMRDGRKGQRKAGRVRFHRTRETKGITEVE